MSRQRKFKPDPTPATVCWRCDDEADHFTRAEIRIEFQDDSYSGTFKLPLCVHCAQSPHLDDLERTW